jgi:DNA modification methylase
MVGGKASPTSRVHCFAASFGRDLARELILEHSPIGGVVLDPFCGSGTTLVEARRCGRIAIGTDVDPIACLISRVQTRTYSQAWLDLFQNECTKRLSHFETELIRRYPANALLRKGGGFAVNGVHAVIPLREEVEYWFSFTQRAVLASLISFKDCFRDKRKRDILSVAISSAIVRKWPNTISCAMDIDHSRPHRARPKPRTVTKNYELFRRILRQMFSTLSALPRSKDEAIVTRSDSAETLGGMPGKTIDLVLSSPPYVNAIDYPRAHKFSEWWLSPGVQHCIAQNYVGLRRERNSKRLGIENPDAAPQTIASLSWLQKHDQAKYTLFAKYLDDMSKVIAGCSKVLCDGGKLVFVVANNRINSRTVPIANMIEELLTDNHFKSVNVRTRRIKTRLRRYPFAFPGRMSSESIIVAKR